MYGTGGDKGGLCVTGRGMYSPAPQEHSGKGGKRGGEGLSSPDEMGNVMIG